MKMVDQKSGEVIWHDKSMVEKSTFAVGTEPLINRENEKRALEAISRNLAVRIYNRTMDRF
jgi:PBP1b-binding outer membrane lipoprotein LpoB